MLKTCIELPCRELQRDWQMKPDYEMTTKAGLQLSGAAKTAMPYSLLTIYKLYKWRPCNDFHFKCLKHSKLLNTNEVRTISHSYTNS